MRRFSVDLVPRVIGQRGSAWGGLIQRARAIEMFLQDVYGAQRVLTDGVLSRELVEQSPAGVRRPPDCRRARSGPR